MGILANAKGIDFGVLKDKGARKLIAAVSGIVAIAVMAIAKVPGVNPEWVLYLVGIFTGGNIVEHMLKAKPPEDKPGP